ncbi:MAG TPA: AIM24 family protein [Mycobacteriales bacterium]|nr:AIM24 family protein [Mycobacteriales bacterium]
MTIQHKIVGTANQMAVIQLEPGQTVYGDRGTFRWKTANVTLETRLTQPANNQAGGPAAAGGFLAKAMDVGKRVLAGEGMAFQYYKADSGSGLVTFAGTIPGELRAIELDGKVGWFAERGAMIAAESTINFDIAFTGLRMGLRGHEGFVLQKFTGAGTLFVAAAGNFIELNPAKYGGTIQAETGNVVAFSDTVQYTIERVGGLNAQTAMTAMFGGEGINLATFRGEGSVILQSTSIHSLGEALRRVIDAPGNDRKGPLAGIGL